MTIELTVHRDGDRDRARGRARGHAAVAEPARSPGRAGSTSGSSAARRCSSSCCSGTSSRRCSRRSTSAIPFGGPSFIHANANSLIPPFGRRDPRRSGSTRAPTWPRSCAPGCISVDEGQTEAAQSLGMRRLQTMRRIVLPQAMRVIIPPTGNETISMLKNTSLASVIGVRPSCCTRCQQIYAAQLQADPAADRREHLVPGDDERPVRRPVLHRAPLRARVLAHRASASRCERAG